MLGRLNPSPLCSEPREELQEPQSIPESEKPEHPSIIIRIEMSLNSPPLAVPQIISSVPSSSTHTIPEPVKFEHTAAVPPQILNLPNIFQCRHSKRRHGLVPLSVPIQRSGRTIFTNKKSKIASILGRPKTLSHPYSDDADIVSARD